MEAATGMLDPAAGPRIEAHVAACPTCRADLAAMQSVARALHDDAGPAPSEDFWLRQRQSIMRRVRAAPAPAAASMRWRGWQLAGALATVVLSFVVTRSVVLHRPPAVPQALDRLDDDALLHLHDLLPALAPASTIEDADSDPLSVHDLGEDELDSLSALLGDSS